MTLLFLAQVACAAVPPQSQDRGSISGKAEEEGDQAAALATLEEQAARAPWADEVEDAHLALFTLDPDQRQRVTEYLQLEGESIHPDDAQRIIDQALELGLIEQRVILASDERLVEGVFTAFMGATLLERLAIVGGVQLAESPVLPFGEILLLVALALEIQHHVPDLPLTELVPESPSVLTALVAWPALFPIVFAFEEDDDGKEGWLRSLAGRMGIGGPVHCECLPSWEAKVEHDCPNVPAPFAVPLNLCYWAALPRILSTKRPCTPTYRPSRCRITPDPSDLEGAAQF